MVRYALNDFDWESFDHQFSLSELEKITAEEFAPLADEIAKNLEIYFNEKSETMFFTYKFSIDFSFRSFKKSFIFENQEKKKSLKKAMDSYIQKVFINESQSIKENREISILCGHLTDFSLMQYTESEFIELIEKGFKFFKQPRNKKFEKTFIQSILHHLLNWKQKVFLPMYYDIQSEFMSFKMQPKPQFAMQSPKSAPKLDPTKVRKEDLPKVALFVRQALWNIQKREPYQRGVADLELAVSDFNSKEAKMYLKKGSGILPDELIYFKDSDLECKANDVFSTISLSLKTETAQTYQKALDFIIKLLNNGFPKSYQIKLSSKAQKQFLPIKGLAKSQTHRFFAQALLFPEIYDKILEYAQTAMVQFEWYEDVEEGEKSCMPSSYAVFGLGLTDEKYFPLVEKYLQSVDDEHQLVHFDFLESFFEKWGVNEKTLPVLLKGAFSGQFDKPFKSVAKNLTDKQRKLIEHQIINYETYDKQTIEFMAFGKKVKK